MKIAINLVRKKEVKQIAIKQHKKNFTDSEKQNFILYLFKKCVSTTFFKSKFKIWLVIELGFEVLIFKVEEIVPNWNSIVPLIFLGN